MWCSRRSFFVLQNLLRESPPVKNIYLGCLRVYFPSLSNTGVCNQIGRYFQLYHTWGNGHPCHVVTASIRDCGSGQRGDSCSSDAREIGADINGTKLWSGRKEKWLGVWTSRSGRGGSLFYWSFRGHTAGRLTGGHRGPLAWGTGLHKGTRNSQRYTLWHYTT